MSKIKLTIIDQESIGKYLQEVRIDKDTKPLTKQEEIDLFNEYKLTASEKVKTRIIKANLRWVISLAKQYSYPKIRLEDLINEGNIGLITAFDKYELDKNVRFATFATFDIRLAINSFIHETGVDIPQPANRTRVNALLKKANLDLRMVGIENPSDEELLEVYDRIKKPTDLKLDLLLLQEIRMNTGNFVSMSTSLSSDGDTLTVGDFISASNDYNADKNIMHSEENSIIVNKLRTILSEREFEIVKLHFGLNCEEKTLEQISEFLGYTRERIGQILQGSLKKLQGHKKLMFEILGKQSDQSSKIDTI